MIFNRNSIQSLKERYPEGTRIELISMNDPFSPVPSGTKGTVAMVDDAGTRRTPYGRQKQKRK